MRGRGSDDVTTVHHLSDFRQWHCPNGEALQLRKVADPSLMERRRMLVQVFQSVYIHNSKFWNKSHKNISNEVRISILFLYPRFSILLSHLNSMKKYFFEHIV